MNNGLINVNKVPGVFFGLFFSPILKGITYFSSITFNLNKTPLKEGKCLNNFHLGKEKISLKVTSTLSICVR